MIFLFFFFHLTSFLPLRETKSEFIVASYVPLIKIDKAALLHVLKSLQDAKLCMRPGKSALEKDGIRLAKGAVCGQFNGGAGHKGTGRHDDIGVIPGHRSRLTGDKAVHGRCGLNALTKGNDAFRLSEGNCLNDVMPVLACVRKNGKAKLFIKICRKNGTL